MGWWLRWENEQKTLSSDLTDAQWEELAPLLPPDTQKRPSQNHGPFVRWSTAFCTCCAAAFPWRLMPHDLRRGARCGGTFAIGVMMALGNVLRKPCGPSSGGCGTGGCAQRSHHRQPVGEDHGKRGPRGYDAGKRVTGTQAAHRGGHHGIAAGGGGSRRQHSGPRRRQAGVGPNCWAGSPSCG